MQVVTGIKVRSNEDVVAPIALKSSVRGLVAIRWRNEDCEFAATAGVDFRAGQKPENVKQSSRASYYCVYILL